jgi:streptogramin lyase
MRNKVLRGFVLGVVAALGVGCGDGESCPNSGTGTLKLNITGLPAGVAPSVEVKGNESRTLTSGDAVSLRGGSYEVRASPVAEAAPLIRKAFGAAPGSPVCVREGETVTVNVPYALIPTSHKLWGTSANSGKDLLGFDPGLLSASSTSPATLGVKLPVTQVRDITFDREGNLWFSEGSGSVKRLSASAVAAGGSPAAEVILTSSIFKAGIPGPDGLAFDKDGNLWVSVVAPDRIVRIDADQLGTSGAPTPAVELSGGALDGPGALAFDAAGNLWVTAQNRVLRFDQAKLQTGTTAGPDLVLEAKSQGSTTATLNGATGLAFDGGGNLWVSYFGPNVIAKLTPSELSGSGNETVTPGVQITLAVSALLNRLMLDEEGGLWTPYSSGRFGRLSPGQLGSSGTKEPDTILTSADLNATDALAIYPAPSTTPLHHRLP